MKLRPFRLALAGLLLPALLHAQAAPVPPLINYQGRVAVDAVNFEGAGLFKFALVNEDGSVSYWSNDGTSEAGSEPANAVPLTVAKGLYSLLLGDATLANMIAIPATAFANPDIRLRVWFDDGVNGSQLLTPDQRLAPAAYLADGAVTAGAIADGVISGAKLAPGSIDGTRLAPGSLDYTHLTVPAGPGAGQVLGFDGASLSWMAPAVVNGGDSVFLRNGTTAYYSGGKVGIGTNAPAHTLGIAGGPQWTSNGWGGAVEFTNSSAIGWKTNGLNSFGIGQSGGGLYFFRTASAPGTFSSPAIYDMYINDGGNVVMTGGGPGFFTVGSPNGESGASIQRGGNRGDVRFEGTTLKLVAGPGSGPPGSLNGIAVATSGNVGIGTVNPLAKLHVVGTIRTSVLTITGGADIAEPFPIQEELEKGSVVVIDDEHPGHLKRSASAYDKRVAGIVSGANGINAGISLRQEGAMEGAQNVALSGRVYVQADASGGAIQPGDMLTSSDTAGHAMKVSDHSRSQGAVIGKAMSALPEGKGLVLVLVTLQ